MNKKLVATALICAWALPLTVEAQVGTLTLYGRANMDLDFIRGPQDDGSFKTIARVSSNTSRFGVRGTEPLGGGLSVFFQLENSVNWDGNGGTIASRNTFLGMQGAFGQVWLGRAFSPYDNVSVPWAPVVLNGNTGIFNVDALWGNASNGGGSPMSGSYDDRYSNSLRWNSPTVRGFTAEVQLSTLENTGHGWAFIPALFYNNGPIQASAAYVRHDKFRCYDANGTSYAACGSVPFAGLAAKDDAFAIGGLYDFGVVSVGLNYEYLRYETPTGTLNRNYWGVTGIIPAGGGNIYLYYGNASRGNGGADDTTPRINSLVHGKDSGAQNFIVGYSYDLSKRTELHAGYALIRNDARAKYTFNANYTTPVGGDPSGIAFGIIHKF